VVYIVINLPRINSLFLSINVSFFLKYKIHDKTVSKNMEL
jgi:hypothetical protein